MGAFVFIILSLIVVAALLVLRWPPNKARVHTIDTVDLFPLANARRAGTNGRRGQAGWAFAKNSSAPASTNRRPSAESS